MRLRLQPALLAFLLLGLPSSWAQDAPAKKPSATATPTTSGTGSAAAELQDAQSYAASNDTARAETAYRKIVKAYPTAPQAAEAQYGLAQALENSGDLSKAFDAYQVLLNKYPSTPRFETAVAAQLAIANQFLAGRKVKILGLALASSMDRAVTMYQAILTNAPFSKNAPVAQFNLGLAYEKQSKTAEAVQAYQAVLDKYPNSDICDDALYQIGFLYMRIGFGSGSQDLSSLQLAKNTFEDFLLQFPSSEKAPQAQDNLKLLTSRESIEITNIAKFYEFYKDHRSAVIYYNDVIRRNPRTEEAETAKAHIEELRGQFGDEALRSGPEKAETGEKLAMRRRLQAQIETSALSNYDGPPRKDIVPDELPVAKPQLRTGVRDLQPLPAVEPALPNP